MNRWSWLCPWLAVLLAASVLVLWGLSWWSALLAALLLVCPALVLWGMFITRAGSDELVVHTHGTTMNWAAPFYDLYCRAVGLGQGFREQTLQTAAIRPGEKILDVGCGTGVLTRLACDAAGPAGSALGIDPTRNMIRIAKENAQRLGSRAEFKVAAIEKLPLEHSSFDVVLSSLMLHHLSPDLKREGLQEVYRVLKPGGRFAVSDVLFQGDMTLVPQELLDDVNAWSGCIAGALHEDDFIARLQAAGFQDANVEVTNVYDGSTANNMCGAPPLPEGVQVVSGFVRATKPARASCCSGSSCC